MARRRRRSKAGDTLTGLVVLGALALAGLSYIKNNVIDFTKPEVWGTALTLVGLGVVLRIISAAANRSRVAREREEAEREAARLQAEVERQAREQLAWGVERAVKIATGQGWVSPHRLRSQIAVTDAQAQAFLSAARSGGLLVQAINGRHYLPDEAERIGVEMMR